MADVMQWLDLYAEGDAHPRRFGGTWALWRYLTRIEGLSEEAADELVTAGRLAPTDSTRGYLLRPVPVPTQAATQADSI